MSDDSSAALVAQILVDGSSDLVFDYAVPLDFGAVVPGCRVFIPLRGHQAVGTVLRLIPVADSFHQLKPLIGLVSPQPMISEKLMELAQWASDYYACPMEQLIRCILPDPVRQEKNQAKLRKIIVLGQEPTEDEAAKMEKRAPRQAGIIRHLQAQEGKEAPLAELGEAGQWEVCKSLIKKGLLSVREEVIHRDPARDENFAPSTPLKLNPQQETSLSMILAMMASDEKKPILLQGVTGSGKTEVYLQAVEETIRAGKGALILVPEISLTPQTLQRFKSRFASLPSSVAILHSALSAGERHDEWHAIQQGKARIVVGPRSAVFAPLQNIGLIIVDEEHDASYKQENAPRYHGRDIAVLRARMEGACVVLGSATPSLETTYNVRQGKYALSLLTERADGQKMPLIRILDMKTEAKDKVNAGILSERLRMAINKRLERHEQSILLLNRRGFARSLQCPDCGHTVTCPHCSMALTYHVTDDRLICHLCGYRALAPRECPECHSAAILLQGFGTQKVEKVLRRCFPEARIARIDADVSRTKHAVRDIFRKFRSRQIDLLLGTQMIAKGLDFPGVTLVGVLNADLGLHVPDPRASERTFQLLTQVAGRAGRGDLSGEVIIQTFSPFAPALQYARHHDTDGFAEQELAMRKQLELPPYSHLAIITVRSPKEELAEFSMLTLYRYLQKATPPSIRISEPAPAPIAKAHGQFRFQCTLQAPNARSIARLVQSVLPQLKFGSDITVTLDIDAYSFF